MNESSDASNMNLDELNAEILKLRGEIESKMDSYFIYEGIDVYNSMLKCKIQNTDKPKNFLL